MLTQQSKSQYLCTSRAQDAGRQDLSDEKPLPGPGTTSSYINAGGGFLGKLPSLQTSVELQESRDGGGYAVVFPRLGAVTGGLGGNAIPAPGSAKFGCSCNDEILQLIVKATPETFTLAKTGSTITPRPTRGLMGQRLQSQRQDVGSCIRPSTYSSQSALPSDNKANYEGRQAATREPIPLTETVSAKKDTPLRCGNIPTKPSSEGSPDTSSRHTRLGGIVALPALQSFSNGAPTTHSEAGSLARIGSDGCNNTALRLISAVPPLADIHDVTSQDEFDLLIQKAYRALFFNTNGAFRSRGEPRSSRDPQSLANDDRVPTANPKRRLRGDHDGNYSDGTDNDRESSRTKRSRVKLRKLGGLPQEFACHFCKHNPDYGYEARCLGWSNSNIDTVLRVSRLYPVQQAFCCLCRKHDSVLTRGQRHLLIHVDIETGHLSKAKYDRVNAMKKDYNCADPTQAKELWIAAYMEIFEIEQRNRHNVPDPCNPSLRLPLHCRGGWLI